jgi:hypothetical protein
MTIDLLLNTIAVFLTLCIFSFLYKDNPFYKFAERLVAGVATGYWTVLLFHTNFRDKVWDEIVINHHWIYIIPALLGIAMWTRFSKNYSWISRYSIAFYIGISSGVTIPVAIYTAVFKQLEATVANPVTFSIAGLNIFLITIAVLSSLVYFFFSAAHKGTMGAASRIGIYVIMIGFGAGFGLTVMGRVALLVQRVIFIKGYVISLGSVFGLGG